MRSEWPRATLGDVVDLLTGHPFKSANYDDSPDSPRLLRGDNVAQGVLRWDGAKRWPKAETSGLDRYWLDEGDVILAMDRPWIEAGLKYSAVSKEDLPCLLVQRVSRLRGKTGLETGFLRYLIGSPQFTEYVLAIQTGTAVPHISPTQIRDFEFHLPPIRVQREISSLLGKIDEKIANNRALAADLEAMARAIFKSWFVDFDPVKAKMEGRAPAGMDADTAALFPDELVESELGLIPKGWEVVALSGMAEFLNGLALQKFPPSGQGDDLPVLKIAQLRARQLDFEKLASRDVGARYLVSSGDLIFSWSGSLIVDFWAGPECALNQHLFKVNPEPWATPGLLWAAIHHHIDQFREIAAGKAVTMGHINRKHLDEAKLALPPRDSVTKFCQQLDSLTEYACQLEVESQELALLRDTLLPRLISGKLQLPPAERAAQSATVKGALSV